MRSSNSFLLASLLLLLCSACAPAPTPDPSPLATTQAQLNALSAAVTALAPTLEYLQLPTATPRPPATATPLPPATATPNPSPTAAPTSTLPPTFTPSPAARAYVSASVSVRAGPGLAYDTLGTAVAGQHFAITGRDAGANWWQIDFSGLTGWIAADLVRADHTENVPAVRDLPTPKPATATRAPTPTATPDPCRYIGNKSTKKLHLATCEYAIKISPQNRVCFATRADALAQGYEPCKVCQP